MRLERVLNIKLFLGISLALLFIYSLPAYAQDVNDVVPTILSSDTLTIHSDVKLNVPIMKVVSADEDQDDAGRVSYSIVGGNSDQTFKVKTKSTPIRKYNFWGDLYTFILLLKQQHISYFFRLMVILAI